MLFLPECFGFIGSSGAETLANAEQLAISDDGDDEANADVFRFQNEALISMLRDNSTTDAATGMAAGVVEGPSEEVSIMAGLQLIARETGLWISGGGIHERGAPPNTVDDQARVFNTHVIIDREGRLVDKYRKIHLFDVSIPDKNIYLCESATTAPGEDLVVCDSPIGTNRFTFLYGLSFVVDRSLSLPVCVCLCMILNLLGQARPGQASSDLVRMMSTPFGVSCLCSNNSPSCECLFYPVLVVCVHG